jgi:hypothetical protein
MWQFDLGVLPSSATACDEKRVMVGLTNGKLMAIDLNLKRRNLNDEPITLAIPQPAWNWQTPGSLTSRPLPAESLVAFGGADGKVYVALANERTMLYRIATGGPIGEGLGAYGTRLLLAPSQDNNVYGIDLFTSKIRWVFPSGAPVVQEPLVAGEDIFVINTAGDISLLSPEDGSPKWTTSTHDGRLVSVGATKIYLRSSDFDLFSIDRTSGQQLDSPIATYLRAGIDLREYRLSFTNRATDRMYFATPSGLILCIREIGQTSPRLLRDPKALPFGYIPPEGLKEETPPALPAAEEEEIRFDQPPPQ